MKHTQLESLLIKIDRLQLIMMEVALNEAETEDEQDDYTELYREIDLQLDLLREERFSVANPNEFESLKVWRRHSWTLGGHADRRVEIYDLYEGTLALIERLLAQQYVVSEAIPETLTGELHPESMKNFLAAVQSIQTIMKQVARGINIEDREETYVKQYRELALQIGIFQEVGLAVSNPNRFRSLWQFYRFWDTELEPGCEARERAVNDLYKEIVGGVDRVLHKHESLSKSVEEFAQDLKCRFIVARSTLSILNTSSILDPSDLPPDASKKIETFPFNIPNQTAGEEIRSDVALTSLIHLNKVDTEKTVNKFSGKQRRIQQEYNSLYQQWNLLSEKIERFRIDLAITAHSPTKFELEKQIERIEVERIELEKRMENLEKS